MNQEALPQFFRVLRLIQGQNYLGMVQLSIWDLILTSLAETENRFGMNFHHDVRRGKQV